MIKDKLGLALRIVALCLVSFFISSRMVSESLAKYSTTATSYDQARVAKFIDINNDISSTGSIIFNDELNLKPGDSKEVTFTIVNNGEVTLTLKLELLKYGTLPLKYYFNDVETLYYEKELEPGESVVVTIDMIWDINDNDYKYSNVVELVKVYAICEQVD